jgi:outer membrane biogenesis lipoprotein LolB
MRRISVLAILGLVSLFLVGCAETNLESSKDHTARIKRNMNKDMKNLVEDWDRFWMADEPSHATMNNM